MTDTAPTDIATIEGETLHGFPVHPAASVFPMLTETQLQELADDIARNGLMEPIVLLDGQVLDGRNRLAACHLANVEPKFVRLTHDQVESPATYVVSLNLHRRMLTASQRAAIALTLERMFAEEARQRSLEGSRRGGITTAARRRGDVVPEFSAAETAPISPTPPPSVPVPTLSPSDGGDSADSGATPPPALPDTVISPFGRKTSSTRSRDQAAALVDVSSGYVSQAKQIEKAAPEMVKDILAGKITIPEAKRQVFPDLTGIKREEPEPPAPRKIRSPRRSGKVTSSRITLTLTVTFGSPEVAQKVLQVLDADPRVLEMIHDTLDDEPEESGSDET